MSNLCLKHIENYWKLKTKNANNLFNEGKYKDALNDYKDALYRAEVLTSNTEVCEGVGIPFIQVYVISCNNLANTYEELGELNNGSKILKRAVYYLIYLAKENSSHITEIKLELKRAAINYFNFNSLKKQPNEEEELMLALKKGLLTE